MLHHPLGAWFLVHSMASARTRTCARGHGRVILGLAPQVVIAHGALSLVTAHVRVSGRRWVRTRLASPICSSDAIHIHIAI